ncbi:MAG: hypothetical protein M1830_008258 [Pleopsidium flavum]|nr:MAG: hypothetical protein M1830_008258 [Pleopsidium flavum]
MAPALQPQHSLSAFPRFNSTVPSSRNQQNLIPAPLRTGPSKSALELLATSSSCLIPPLSPSLSPSSPPPSSSVLARSQIPHAYNCTLCALTFDLPPYTLSLTSSPISPTLSLSPRSSLPSSSLPSPISPSSSNSNEPILCSKCLIWISDISICWSCTETVTPLRPPPWSDSENGMELSAPPVCNRCSSSSSLGPSLAASPGELGGLNEGDDRSASGADAAVGKKVLRSLVKKESGVLRRLTEVGEEEDFVGGEFDADGRVKRKRRGSGVGDGSVEKRRRGDRDGMVKDALWSSAGTVPKNLPDLVRLSSRAGKRDDTVRKGPTVVARNDPVPASAPVNYISIVAPLESTQTYTTSRDKPLPHWMSLLPSNRGHQPPRRPSAPTTLPSRASLIGNPPSLDTKLLPTAADQSPPFQSPETIGPPRRQTFPERALMQREQTKFPFFQNPRAPITPPIDSSWGVASSRIGSTPFPKAKATTSTGFLARLEGQRASGTGFQSTEYLEKYRQLAPGTSSNHVVASELDMCPCCSTNTIASEKFLGSNGKVYHSDCFTCRICSAGFISVERMTDWIFLKQQPYHVECIKTKAPALAEKLKWKESTKGDRLDDVIEPRKSKSRLSLKTVVEQAAPAGTSAGLISSTLQSRGSTGTCPGTTPALLKELSGFFSTRKKPLPVLGGLEPCAPAVGIA